MHIKAILETGGCVLGNRSLASDGLSAFTFIHGATIQKGFTPVRKWRKQDNENLPTFSWWGYDVAQIIANKHFAESVAKSDSEI